VRDSLTPSADKAAEMARSYRPSRRSSRMRWMARCWVGIFRKGSALAYLPPKRDNAAEVPPPLALIGLHVADALAVALCFGYRREDRKDELRYAVPGHVAARYLIQLFAVTPEERSDILIDLIDNIL
jgi:hypothetical protein